jgi:hypothetical protein
MFFVELFRSKGLNPGVAPGFSGLPPLNDTVVVPTPIYYSSLRAKK